MGTKLISDDLPSYGIRLIDFATHSPSKEWKLLEIDDTVPLETQSLCPADNTRLRVLCTLTSSRGAQTIRYGCCESCGYIGFMDRPTKQWMAQYYLNVWREGEQKALNLKVGSKYTREIVPQLIKLGASKDRFVCEIGCGHGSDLKAFEEAGFKVIGVENSKSRARIAAEQFGVTVLTGPFESDAVQNELRNRAPFSIVYSIHVLEHTYDPSEVISNAAKLQSPGDFLVLSLPDVIDESPMNIMFFLPHLHSFSKKSLINLLQKHGYTPIDGPRSFGVNSLVIAKKISPSDSKPILNEPADDYFGLAIQRFSISLGLNKKGTRYLSWFLTGSDVGATFPWFLNPLKSTVIFRTWAALVRWWCHKNGAVVNFTLVSELKHRKVPTSESPIEIQFPKNIQLFIK